MVDYLLKKVRKSTLGLLAPAVLALVVSACGSSSSPAPTPTPLDSQAAVLTATATSAPSTPIATPSATAVPTAATPPVPVGSTPTLTPSPAPAVGSTQTVTQPPQAAQTESATARAERLGEEAFEFLTRFTDDLSPRASGTEQELAAAEFLAEQLEALGYSVEVQRFEVESFLAQVAVAPPRGRDAPEIRSVPMTFSGEGNASGVLVHVGQAFPEDIPEGGLEGKIALIRRGAVTFQQKVTRVAEAGAVGAIVYNNRPGLFGGTLRDQAVVLAVSVSQEIGEAILALMEVGDVEAAMSVITVESSSQNVIAEKPGSGADGRVVVLGGHYDTVPDVPGANDNGSGTASFVTVARELADATFPFSLRFIAFGSEETGLRGSRFYVDSLNADEQASIIAMLNFDALATSDILGIAGDPDLVANAIEYGEANGIELVRRSLPRNASSDHASFQAVGIPVVFFLDTDFSRIHTPADRMEFVRPDMLGNSAVFGIAILNSLAKP